jgi:hypothetical protein
MSLSTHDEAQLRRLAVSYARGVDRRDRALFLSAFHPDATLTLHSGKVLRGHDEIGRVTESIKRYGTTFHFLGQSAYEPPDDGLDMPDTFASPSGMSRGVRGVVPPGDTYPPGTARGEVYCIAHHWTEGWPTVIMYIRYQDVYRQDDAGWLITSRRLIVDAQDKQGG